MRYYYSYYFSIETWLLHTDHQAGLRRQPTRKATPPRNGRAMRSVNRNR